MVVDFGEAFLDMGGLGPDAVGDEQFLVIRQMHQAGEILAQADRVDEYTGRPAGWVGRQDAQRDGIQRAGRGLGIRPFAFDQHRSLIGKSERQRNG